MTLEFILLHSNNVSFALSFTIKRMEDWIGFWMANEIYLNPIVYYLKEGKFQDGTNDTKWQAMKEGDKVTVQF